jgi:hypothetical protein
MTENNITRQTNVVSVANKGLGCYGEAWGVACTFIFPLGLFSVIGRLVYNAEGIDTIYVCT